MLRKPKSLSHILAIRMGAVAVSASLLMAGGYFVRYISDTSHLREATLHASAYAIGAALSRGEDPRKLPLYRDYPGAYGFRVYDRRLLETRRILASANTRWLPPVQHAPTGEASEDADDRHSHLATDLFEDFERYRPAHATFPAGQVVSLLIHRVTLPGHKYWVQAYMIGDPAWAGLSIIFDKLITHVLIPVIFLIPLLTLAMFLTTRAALRPLRRLSGEASLIGTAVARGRPLAPVPDQGMAREFADVAAAINAMLGKLESSLQLQKQFTSDAAHELRTPLAVLLLEASQLPPGSARERIKTDLEGLGQLVNELLRFAQAEDELAHELNDVDVVAVARRVCEDAVIAAIVRSQMIEFESSAPHMVMAGSAALIEIAIRNLVDNALKYSPIEATVSVRVEPGPVVIVEDDGPGIPAGQRDHVFQRFWRADRNVGIGAGVGLALVRRIAQLHDGSVRLEDRASGGTRAVLSFATTETARRLLGSAERV